MFCFPLLVVDHTLYEVPPLPKKLKLTNNGDIVVALCQLAQEDESVLLKTPHNLDMGHSEIMLELSWNPSYLASTVSEVPIQGVGKAEPSRASPRCEPQMLCRARPIGAMVVRMFGW